MQRKIRRFSNHIAIITKTRLKTREERTEEREGERCYKCKMATYLHRKSSRKRKLQFSIIELSTKHDVKLDYNQPINKQ